MRIMATIKRISQLSLLLTVLLFMSGSVITGCAKRPEISGGGIEQPQSDKILHVGDTLPPFVFNDIVDSNYGTSWTGGIEQTASGPAYGPGVITLREKGAWIELKDGTRYMCLTEGGCRISWNNYAIIEGAIKVSYKK